MTGRGNPRPSGAAKAGGAPARRTGLPRGPARAARIALAALALILWGCAPFPTIARERDAVLAGEKALVLVRVRCTVDGQPFAPCLYRTGDAPLSDPFFVGFALGGFATLGEPGPADPRALSEASLAAGWAVFVLPPGLYYLSVRGPDSAEVSKRHAGDYYREQFRRLPRWRIDVPAGAKGIYAGTLHLAGKSTGTLLFGDPVIAPFDHPDGLLSDEGALAGQVLARDFPEAGEPRTILMRRWQPGEPVILRAPLPPPTN